VLGARGFLGAALVRLLSQGVSAGGSNQSVDYTEIIAADCSPVPHASGKR